MSNTIISDIESLKILRELEQSKKELTELEGIINAAVESCNYSAPLSMRGSAR